MTTIEECPANDRDVGRVDQLPLRARGWALILSVLNLGRRQQRSAACCSAEPGGQPASQSGFNLGESAEKLKALATGKPPWPAIDADKAIPWVEQRTKLALAE
jgi:hypothetical protein